jgi:hypothetical protein
MGRGSKTFELDEGTLLPVWWPREDPEDGSPLSKRERVESFRAALESILSSPRVGLGTVPAPTKALTPEEVLKAVLFLRDVYAPHDNLAPD